MALVVGQPALAAGHGVIGQHHKAVSESSWDPQLTSTFSRQRRRHSFAKRGRPPNEYLPLRPNFLPGPRSSGSLAPSGSGRSSAAAPIRCATPQGCSARGLWESRAPCIALSTNLPAKPEGRPETSRSSSAPCPDASFRLPPRDCPHKDSRDTCFIHDTVDLSRPTRFTLASAESVVAHPALPLARRAQRSGAWHRRDHRAIRTAPCDARAPKLDGG